MAGAFEYGGYWAVSTTPAPSAAIQAYEAALWSNINDAWEAVSIFGIGPGSVLLASALGRVQVLPRWMAKIAWAAAAFDLVGALTAGLSGYYKILSLGFILPIVGQVVFVILAFTIPRTLRRVGPTAIGQPLGT